MPPLDITKLSETELKALCWDESLKIENARGNINLIQQEIQKRTMLPDAKQETKTVDVAEKKA